MLLSFLSAGCGQPQPKTAYFSLQISHWETGCCYLVATAEKKSPEAVVPQRLRDFGTQAQLVRAPASHAGGHWFESSSLHQKVPDFVRNQELFLFISSNSDAAFWRFSLDPNRDPKAERSGKHRRGTDGIIRPSPAVFVGYMVWLMTLPMVSAASRFIPSVA